MILLVVGADPFTLTSITRAVGEFVDVIGADGSDSPGSPQLPGDQAAVMIAAAALDDIPSHISTCRRLVFGPAEIAEHLDPDMADDFIVMPWTESELRYRVRRLFALRRVVLADGILLWSAGWIEARLPGVSPVRVSLSATESRLFDAIARANGDPVPREVLGSGIAADGRALDMHISRIRRRLAQVTEGWRTSPRIISHRGRGYAFVP